MSKMMIVAEIHEASLKDLLKGWRPHVKKGQVLELTRELEDGTDETVLLQDLVPGAEGYLDSHPEGSDRGGYVPTVYFGYKKVYWDTMDGSWYR